MVSGGIHFTDTFFQMFFVCVCILVDNKFTVNDISEQYTMISVYFRILLEPTKNCLNCTYKLHRVTSAELQLCDTVSTFTNTSVWMIPDLKKNSTPTYFTDLHLDKGFHFFIGNIFMYIYNHV